MSDGVRIGQSLFRPLGIFGLAISCACAGPVSAPAMSEDRSGSAVGASGAGGAVDDGSYLARIDPLGGKWRVESIGKTNLVPFDAYVMFSDGGFLNHGAGCRGGHPAFYRLDGERLSIVRREKVQIGKCGSRPGAAESERRLGTFLDQVSGWQRSGGMLTLTARDGTAARLTRPVEPHPQLAGRWIIDEIGGKKLVTERRPATLSFTMNDVGAHADCNRMSASFTVPAPGRLVVSGPVTSTLIGCSPEDRAEDNLIAGAMVSATGYRLDGAKLILSGGPGMVLRRPVTAGRRLAGEYEHCGNTMLGAAHEGPVTLTIDQRTIRDNAGCTATYRTDGPNLALQLSAAPACAAPSPAFVPGEAVGIGGTISPLAVTRPDGFAFNDEGHLVLRTRRGLLNMCRKGAPRPFGS
jgi:heat shock protein HslJ